MPSDDETRALRLAGRYLEATEQDRERDAAYRAAKSPPKQLGARAFLGIVGLKERFARTVPDEYLDRSGDVPVVKCLCGARPVVPVSRFVECPGACNRWFLNTSLTVRVARFEVEAEQDLAA